MSENTPTEREAIARIIDPRAWAHFDRLIEEANNGRYRDGQKMTLYQATSQLQDAPGLTRESLSKADAILSRPSPPSVAAEVVERLFDTAKEVWRDANTEDRRQQSMQRMWSALQAVEGKQP